MTLTFTALVCANTDGVTRGGVIAGLSGIAAENAEAALDIAAQRIEKQGCTITERRAGRRSFHAPAIEGYPDGWDGWLSVGLPVAGER